MKAAVAAARQWQSGKIVATVLRSESVQVALWVGLGGAFLAAANLLLAGLLDASAFGWLSLYQAMLSAGVSLAPFGLDGLIVRRELRSDVRVLTLVAPLALLAGLLLGPLGLLLYDLSPGAAALLGGGCVVGGLVQAIAACERAELRPHRAQLYAQLPFLLFFGWALVLYLGQGSRWEAGAAGLAAGYGIVAVLGVALLAGASPGTARGRMEAAGLRPHWPTALAFLGISGSVLLLFQLERLLIPHLLTLSDLGTFAVVAILVASPYRLLQMGIIYSLVPRLRSASGAADRRRIIRAEVKVAVALAVGGGVVLAGLAGPLIRLLYGDKYPADFMLILSVILAGCAKVASGVMEGVVGALGNAGTLSRYNWGGWLATGGAAVAAVPLARFGLAGIVAAAGLGWVGRSMVARGLLRRQTRER